MRSILRGFACAAAFGLAGPALAAPGLGSEIYGATVEQGEPEVEVRYDALAGGADDGEDLLKLEASYGVTDRLQLGVQAEFEREAGLPRKAEEVGVEAIYELGRVGGVDVALYGEYAIAFDGADAVESKLLLQRRTGKWDMRLNLIAERKLIDGAPVELQYAASADVQAFGEVRLGVQAFGELGTFSHFLPRAEHFAGPVAKVEIEGLGPELVLTTGYLFALSKARDDSKGMFRLAIELEF
ncbi:MAG: hypothetical protein KGL44_07500 [Sphingomonadales bacterium]|nr:hypothetical protein [Sphingomonadales bacterium]